MSNFQRVDFVRRRSFIELDARARAKALLDAISEDLANNIAHGVRWYDMTAVLEELGFRVFLEMPPGHVLSVLAKEAFPDVRTLALGETSIRQALRLVGQYSRN